MLEEMNKRLTQQWSVIGACTGKTVAGMAHSLDAVLLVWSDGSYSYLTARTDYDGNVFMDESPAGIESRWFAEHSGLITEKEGEAWGQEERDKRAAMRREADLCLIRELMALYPQEACQPSSN